MKFYENYFPKMENFKKKKLTEKLKKKLDKKSTKNWKKIEKKNWKKKLKKKTKKNWKKRLIFSIISARSESQIYNWIDYQYRRVARRQFTSYRNTSEPSLVKIPIGDDHPPTKRSLQVGRKGRG